MEEEEEEKEKEEEKAMVRSAPDGSDNHCRGPSLIICTSLQFSRAFLYANFAKLLVRTIFTNSIVAQKLYSEHMIFCKLASHMSKNLIHLS